MRLFSKEIGRGVAKTVIFCDFQGVTRLVTMGGTKGWKI